MLYTFSREVTLMTDTNHLEAALQQLLQERAELDTVIAALQKRLGTPTTSATLPLPTGGKPSTPAASADAVVYRGAFFNLSITKAAEKLLKTFGRPIKTPEILSAFAQAGYEVKGKNARAVVYTSLLRSKDFVKVLPDTWDLAEKHPEAAQQKVQELAEKSQEAKNKAKKAAKGAKAAEKAKSVVEPIKAAAVA
jgi:hypothetical protein